MLNAFASLAKMLGKMRASIILVPRAYDLLVSGCNLKIRGGSGDENDGGISRLAKTRDLGIPV